MDAPYDVTVAPGGNVAIADSYNRRVRRVRLDGILRTIGGTTGVRASLETGLATETVLGMPTTLALTPDGELVIADIGWNDGPTSRR